MRVYFFKEALKMNFKFLAMTLILTLSPSMSYPSETTWVSGADDVGNTLKEGQTLYEAGKMQGAKEGH